MNSAVTFLGEPWFPQHGTINAREGSHLASQRGGLEPCPEDVAMDNPDFRARELCPTPGLPCPSQMTLDGLRDFPRAPSGSSSEKEEFGG